MLYTLNMNENYIHTMKQEGLFYVDDYLFDPNINVSTMLEQYDISRFGDDRRERKQLEKRDLQCVVCGARAFGYNFDQITCESCKAFFRRNALRNLKEFCCRFNGDCQINAENRRHCAGCRIRKCFAVGMRKEWIRSEEEKAIKRIRLDMTRRSKHNKVAIDRRPSDFQSISLLNSTHRTHLNNLVHCYDQYVSEPTISGYNPSKELLCLRLHDFYNRKRPINIDDQVLLIKQNAHALLPINYALLKTPSHSKFRYTYVQTIGCINQINLHTIYQFLSNSFVSFVVSDPLVIKLFTVILFFTTNIQTTNIDTSEYKQLDYIKRTQTNYVELLWLYMLEKFGENQARTLYMNMILKYLHLQDTIEQINTIIRLNEDVQFLDGLLKTILQLT
ncbi:unnamed protein product [Adineta ricciae]|uniref:Nuclear receptor domain-containing protein n=1 Tax=Adineta ricciae TaxID=249248 RepID=A0A814B413_ADIRI|nr:unnamed protein product [Adineta ricciae]